jgi:two-component system, chemotaxis family, CheB/CheR fusion protein
MSTLNSQPPLYYVGVGASAGGLEAIEAFFKQMPPDSGLAFVVVQHLSPDYKSLMAELLSKHTAMPVLRSEDGMQVQPNHVYLIPPKKNLTIFHGKLLLKDQDVDRSNNSGINLPIDIFLRSLAEDVGEKAVAVILSGTGSDGTRGIRSIKEQGGMIMVQSEESAKFDGMPKSAITTGLADFILPPEEMPEQLLSFVKHPYASKAECSAVLGSDEDGLTRIFALLREKSKLDFTFYKPSTVIRRIERRMTVNQIQELRDYVRLLERFPAELTTLYREMLIGVTSFFRDKEAWEFLGNELLPTLFEQHGERELRFWVAGCSTGEEAYTLAMISREVMERTGRLVDIKIFATDVDRDAIQRAGTGIYPESIVADLTPHLLGKYFQRKDDNFHISRSIREMVVFAPHNLLKDPPFTNIDFISCRNMLIYLQPVLQKKSLDLFSFSLNADGILLLGSSETIGDATDVYDNVHQKWRFYRAKGKRRLSETHDVSTFAARNYPVTTTRVPRASLLRNTEEDRLLSRLLTGLSGVCVPLALVVNEHLELLHVVGDSEGFLQMPSGRVQNEITRLAARDLSIPLATGLQKAFKTHEMVIYNNVHVKGKNDSRILNLRFVPLPGKKGYDPLTAILVEPVESRPSEITGGDTYDLDREAEQRIHDLEAELQFTRENLQATVEELETSNEELQATNEELLASNEELQSTNEELQSVNEELYTVNAEFQTKITELSQLNSDLDNLIAGTEIAILFLDEDLQVRRYTPALTHLCRIIDSDIGRPLSDLSHQLVDVDLPALARLVQLQRTNINREVSTRDNRWYLLDAHPYCLGRELTRSVVISLVEVTQLKRAQEALALSQERNSLAQKAARIATWDWDILSGNLHWSENIESLLGMPIGSFKGTYEAFLERVYPDDRVMLQQAVTACIDGKCDYNIEHRVVWPDGSVHWLAGSGNVHRDGNGRAISMLGVVRDINDNKQTQLRLHDTHIHFRRLFDEAPHLIFLLDNKGTILEVNQVCERMLDYTSIQVQGMSLKQLLPETYQSEFDTHLQTIAAGQRVIDQSLVLLNRQGQLVLVEFTAIPEILGQSVNGMRIVIREQRSAQNPCGQHHG